MMSPGGQARWWSGKFPWLKWSWGDKQLLVFVKVDWFFLYNFRDLSSFIICYSLSVFVHLDYLASVRKQSHLYTALGLALSSLQQAS